MKHNISYLFLRGLTRNHMHWRRRESYEDILGQKVYFLDPPGFGRNHKLTSPNSIQKITDYIKSVWDGIAVTDPDSKKVIVGLSLGGMIALDWMARHPQDWTGAVMINSSVSNLSWPWERIRPRNILIAPKYFLSVSAKAIEEVIFEATCNTTDKKEAIIKNWTEIRKNYPYSKLSAFNQLFAASRFVAPEIEKIKAPALILTGKKDRLVSYKCSVAIAQKYNFEIKYSEKSGHDMAVDDDLWMLQQIKEFTSKLT